ncbi:MAG: ribosome silencing factor [Bilophila wadsworthia]|uniref:ribosome silencing factor n=1 Tax=Bilophila wadsworthia TaxID=35833 RepID=UPI00068B09A7|nr:ribosome silencing factor [Bilophila wadsworthia]MBS1377504.1 ribosome silencing factor [Desulfovibrionaceae bacterium]MDR4027802.1 ribosome silencing factor [Bilophila sp.]MDY3682253.1 ribosome silencing factor [Bilophila wadsworthia]
MKWLEESKARDVVALDVAGKSPCMDVVIVVTASSLRHAKSLADGLMEQCTKNNYEFLRMEGYQTGQWILADLNDIVVHIFQQDVRELFRIESLWKESPALYGEMPAVSPRHAEPAGDED